jgi:hypothetical protein
MNPDALEGVLVLAAFLGAVVHGFSGVALVG